MKNYKFMSSVLASTLMLTIAAPTILAAEATASTASTTSDVVIDDKAESTTAETSTIKFNSSLLPILTKQDPANDYANLIKDSLLIPRNFYLLNNKNVGGGFSVLYRNALLTLYPEYSVCFSASERGENQMDRWFYANGLSTGTFDVTFTANTPATSIQKTSTMHVVDTSDATPVRLLPIGDSLTRAGVYLSRIKEQLPNVTIYGTREYYDDGLPAREGRGGWTLDNYFNNICSSLDSPFLFPKDVPAENYKGNAQNWRKICYESPSNHAYKGFQKLAKDFGTFDSFLYDKKGYYKYPKVGDVMCDPDMKYGSKWVKWNGAKWEAMATPTEFEFNFEKYIKANKNVFTNGDPTHVSILLGANEFGFNKHIEKADEFVAQIQAMINSIHAYNPNINIILCLPTLGPNTSMVTSTNNKPFYQGYDVRVKYATSKLLEAFDTPEMENQKVYICAMTDTLDTSKGFNYVEKKGVTDVDNSIHPSNQFGQLQMGDSLAAVIQATRQ